MCAGAIYWSGIKTVVYALPEAELKTLAGEPTFDLPCREVLARGSSRVPVEVRGPLLVEEAKRVHEGFWKDHVNGPSLGWKTRMLKRETKGRDDDVEDGGAGEQKMCNEEEFLQLRRLQWEKRRKREREARKEEDDDVVNRRFKDESVTDRQRRLWGGEEEEDFDEDGFLEQRRLPWVSEEEEAGLRGWRRG